MFLCFSLFFPGSEAVRGIPVPGGMNGSSSGGTVPTSLSGQQLASAIPSPTASKSWRSKSMNLKHSATSSMLASPTHSPSTTPSPQAPEGLPSQGSDGLKVGSAVVGGPQRSMLEKFRLINPRSALRASPSVAEMALQEEDDLSEYGEDGLTPTGSLCSSGSSSATAKQVSTKSNASSLTAPSKTSSSFSKSVNSSRSMGPSKDKEDKSKSGKSFKDSSPPKEERESFADSTKKTSKIASLIPKGGKSSSGKKDGGASSASTGIPKPGLKAPSTSTAKPQSQSQTQSQAALNSSGNMRGGEGERGKLTKGGQGGSFYIQRTIGGPEGKRTSMTSSTSTSALSGSSGTLGGGGGGGGGALGGNGVVQLPQQQQHNHPNTATVAPFMYRWDMCTTINSILTKFKLIVLFCTICIFYSKPYLHLFRHTCPQSHTHILWNPGVLPVISWRSSLCLLLSPPHLFTIITEQINIPSLLLAKAYYLTVWVSSLMWEYRHWQQSGTHSFSLFPTTVVLMHAAGAYPDVTAIRCTGTG